MTKKEKDKKKNSMVIIQNTEIEKPDYALKNNIFKNNDKRKYNAPVDSQLIVLSETPERAAESLLVELSDILHLQVDHIDLRVIERKSTPTGYLVKFQQYSQDKPVDGAEITVQSDNKGIIRSISAQCIQGC